MVEQWGMAPVLLGCALPPAATPTVCIYGYLGGGHTLRRDARAGSEGGGGSSDAVALQYHDAGNHPIEVGRNGATPAAAGGHQLTSIRERERCRAAAIGEILSGCATAEGGASG